MWEFSQAVAGFALWFAGFLVPWVAAPPFWRMAKAPRRWWLHGAFLPVVLGIEWCLAWLLFWLSADAGEGVPGMGLALAPTLLSTLIVLAGYYLALLISIIRRAMA